LENDSVIHTAFGFGDAWDGWSRRTGFRRLSLETNPAPVPVYTLRSAEGYQGPNPEGPQPYDNRIIWLSGLSITLLDERPDGTVLIEVAWDDFTVRKDVRWCGDIRLSRNPFDSLAPSLILRKATILLDRSESPVYAVARSYDSLTKRFWLSDTTVLRLLPGAILELRGGRIVLRRGSRLILEAGSTLRGRGKIIVEPGGAVEVQPGASLSVPLQQRRKPRRTL